MILSNRGIYLLYLSINFIIEIQSLFTKYTSTYYTKILLFILNVNNALKNKNIFRIKIYNICFELSHKYVNGNI